MSVAANTLVLLAGLAVNEAATAAAIAVGIHRVLLFLLVCFDNVAKRQIDINLKT